MKCLYFFNKNSYEVTLKQYSFTIYQQQAYKKSKLNLTTYYDG